MKVILPIFLTFMVPLVCSASELSNQELFTDANALFDRANEQSLVNPAEAQELYQSAVLKYQFLIDQRGVQTAELHANLANAFFSNGDKGRAILHYQRALDLNPTNEDIQHNLRYVRSLTIDELPVTRSQKIVQTLTFWHRWPFSIRATCFGIAHALLWGMVAVLFYLRRRWVYWLIAGSAVLSIGFGLSLLVSHQRWDNPVDGVIVEREVIARQGNGIIYGNAFESALHSGTEFSVIEQRGDWFHARLLNGDTCWLPQESVELVR